MFSKKTILVRHKVDKLPRHP